MAAKKVGRPRKGVSLRWLQVLASVGCTQDEAARFLRVSASTLDRRLAEDKYRVAWEEGVGEARFSLRRKLYKLADHNVAAAIFLAKNELGMRDVQRTEVGGSDGAQAVKVVIGVDMKRFAEDDVDGGGACARTG